MPTNPFRLGLGRALGRRDHRVGQKIIADRLEPPGNRQHGFRRPVAGRRNRDRPHDSDARESLPDSGLEIQQPILNGLSGSGGFQKVTEMNDVGAVAFQHPAKGFQIVKEWNQAAFCAQPLHLRNGALDAAILPSVFFQQNAAHMIHAEANHVFGLVGRLDLVDLNQDRVQFILRFTSAAGCLAGKTRAPAHENKAIDSVFITTISRNAKP
jgi:hypothetical protein